MNPPVQPFFKLGSAMFGHDSMVARRVTEIQTGSNSDLIPLEKSSARNIAQPQETSARGELLQ